MTKGRPSGLGPADVVARRQISGGPTADDVALGAETPELRALHQAEMELFPPAMPQSGALWPDQLPSPLSEASRSPRVHASGLPAPPAPATTSVAEGGKDLSWLTHLKLPDIPVRWDPRVVRYLEFYKDDPRGRQLFAYWLHRSGRYAETIRRSFRKKALPEDLAWIAMIESGYDPGARSPAGAAGLWQFMPETARLYGLGVDRWADQRLNPPAATDAAAEMMGDLYRRFGSWELAAASYNMGYAGMMSIVRRYNTNDYWTLSRLEGALPWETTLYVPKLIAVAIVGKNLSTFGYESVLLDAPVDFDEVRCAPGTSLAAVAQAAGVPLKEIETANLELRAGRTPPAPPDLAPADLDSAYYAVKVPRGKGAQVLASLSRLRGQEAPVEQVVVRFGESIEQIAAERHVTVARIMDLNAIAPGETVRGGTVLLVPRMPAQSAAQAQAKNDAQGGAAAQASKPVIVVPPTVFVYPDRRRVFYRVLAGDTLREIADAFHVSADDLTRWNELDPAARLMEGMTLQVFVPPGTDLSKVAFLPDGEARTITAGTQEFFDTWEGAKGKRRVLVTAKAGDTLDAIGRRYGVPASTMERANRRGRGETLKDGETVVLYLPGAGGALAGTAKAAPAVPTVLAAAAAVRQPPAPEILPSPSPFGDRLPPLP